MKAKNKLPKGSSKSKIPANSFNIVLKAVKEIKEMKEMKEAQKQKIDTTDKNIIDVAEKDIQDDITTEQTAAMFEDNKIQDKKPTNQEETPDNNISIEDIEKDIKSDMEELGI